MSPSFRLFLAAAVIAAALLPTVASAQLSMLRPGAAGPDLATLAAAQRPDGQVRYALGAGASYSSGTAANAASFNVGAESAVATTDTRWRFGGKALWSRSAGEGTSENVKLLLVQESQHRWSGSTWLREKLSVLPGLRANEGLRTTLETGLAIATTPFCKVTLGVLRSYDPSAPPQRNEPVYVTAIDIKLP